MAAFAPLLRALGQGTWTVVALVLGLGTAVELVGVLTGFPFGRYVYTDRWWPAVRLNEWTWFPLAVPFAWCLMAGASYLTVTRLGRGTSRFLYIPLAGLLAAGVDLMMEPVMVHRLAYWQWQEPGPLPGGAPVSNFLGWFGTTAVAATVLHSFGAAKAWESPEPRVVLAGHAALTLGIGLLP